MNNIPKNLFMIWFGDIVPNYVQFSVDAYKIANCSFNVQLIRYTLKQLKDIYDKKLTSIYDKLLYESIYIILNRDIKYIHLLDKTYMYILQHQEIFYGKEIRFIQLLSDIYRLKLLEEFGGIYVDCDTFPLRPFDEDLLSLKCFSVTRHYNNNASNNIGNDNYFLGSIKHKTIHNDAIKLLQTNDKWWANIKYLINKRNFFNLTLKYVENTSQPLYIEHYFDGNWKNKNGIIRTPKCFLDKIKIHNEY